jgi:anti-sigma regulatory factor (Ser/Thr protein kinase)
MAAMTVDADLVRLAVFRALVREVALSSNAPPACLDDLVQAVDEAATNIVLHGYERRGGVIDVDARLVDDHIVIELSDTAPTFDPTTVPEPDLSVPALRRHPGGMGIHLIRLATDSITHRPRRGGGNILTLTRSLDPRPKEER